MDPVELLTAVDHGIAVPGAVVLRFQRGRTILNMLLYGAFGLALVVFALVIAPSVNMRAGGVVYGAAAVGLALVALAFWRSLSKLRDLLHASTNVLVVVPDGVVLRRRGRVESFPLAEFPDVNVVKSSGRVETIYLNRANRTFDRELVDDGSFGPMEEILRALQSRRG